jgi:capsular polysaccharide transport system ATP-binding protein
MIEARNLQKIYHTRHGPVTVLDNVCFSLQKGEKIGILGRNGAGKSTLIRMLSGAERQTSGELIRTMSVSWPLAFGGAFQGSLTGADNLRFICRVYGVSWQDKLDYLNDFAELGRYLYEPVKTYSSGMRARLAFAISMVVEFDCFLIDEIIAVGDHRFHEKCQIELFEKRADRSMIIVSHDADFVAKHCDKAAVLLHKTLHCFDSTDEAYAFYHNNPGH